MIKKIVLFFVLFLISSMSVFAVVEKFTNYETEITITNDNIIKVNRSLNLRNIHEVGIVPGAVEFKIDNAEGDILLLKDTVMITDRYGSKIKNTIMDSEEGYTMMINIFTPLLPGFEYKINVYYELKVDGAGFIFKNFEVPIMENTNIPVEKGTFKLNIPERLFINYVGPAFDNADVNKKSIVLNIDKDTQLKGVLQYSLFPFQFKNIKMSYIFLILVNIALIFVLIYAIKKKIIEMNSDNE